MIFDLFSLTFVVAGTFVFGGIALMVAKGWAQRLILFGLLGGLFFYSGIGTANIDVPSVFLAFYLSFFIAVIVGFHFGRALFLPLSRAAGRKMPQLFDRWERRRLWHALILVYILLYAFSRLIWPEYNLHRLFAPPSPDLTTAFFQKFTGEAPDHLSRLIGYVLLLLTPFFYAGLYIFRNRIKWVAVIFVVLLYIDYVSKASIGRGLIMMHIGYIILALWLLRPHYRRNLVIVGVSAMPLVFFALHWYSVVRIGGDYSSVGFQYAISRVLETELGFVKDVGVPIFEAGARVDLSKYFVWIVTLPVPKIFTGPIEGARINYEISEIVLGLPTGALGWYVVLPGLVAEALYIYGPWLYWIHGLFLGCVASFFARLLELSPQFIFLYVHIVILFAYVLNRAGIAAFLPTIINIYMLFYLIIFATIYLTKSKSVTR